MTPDQMNVDALLQSGQYLNTTISSDGGSTTDFGRTGELGTVRSTDFTHSRELQVTRGSATRSADFGTRSGQFGTRSGEFGTRSEDFGTRTGEFGTRTGEYGTRSGEFGTRTGEYSVKSGEAGAATGEHAQYGMASGTFGRSGRLTYTTSEFGQTGGSDYTYSGPPGGTAGSQDLQQSGYYPDSLEGTGVMADTGTLSESYGRNSGHRPINRSTPLQVSVTIPSMAQSDSGSEDGESGSIEDVSEISMGN